MAITSEVTSEAGRRRAVNRAETQPEVPSAVVTSHQMDWVSIRARPRQRGRFPGRAGRVTRRRTARRRPTARRPLQGRGRRRFPAAPLGDRCGGGTGRENEPNPPTGHLSSIATTPILEQGRRSRPLAYACGERARPSANPVPASPAEPLRNETARSEIPRYQLDDHLVATLSGTQHPGAGDTEHRTGAVVGRRDQLG